MGLLKGVPFFLLGGLMYLLPAIMNSFTGILLEGEEPSETEPSALSTGLIDVISNITPIVSLIMVGIGFIMTISGMMSYARYGSSRSYYSSSETSTAVAKTVASENKLIVKEPVARKTTQTVEPKKVTIWDNYRSVVPSAEKKILSNIESLVTALETVTDLSTEDEFDKNNIIKEHIPKAIKLYQKATQRKTATPEVIELLNSQLTSVQNGLQRILTTVDEDTVREMKIQSSFLKGKFVPKDKMLLQNSKQKEKRKSWLSNQSLGK